MNDKHHHGEGTMPHVRASILVEITLICGLVRRIDLQVNGAASAREQRVDHGAPIRRPVVRLGRKRRSRVQSHIDHAPRLPLPRCSCSDLPRRTLAWPRLPVRQCRAGYSLAPIGRVEAPQSLLSPAKPVLWGSVPNVRPCTVSAGRLAGMRFRDCGEVQRLFDPAKGQLRSVLQSGGLPVRFGAGGGPLSQARERAQPALHLSMSKSGGGRPIQEDLARDQEEQRRRPPRSLRPEGAA